MIFIDLEKAHDGVPNEVLWKEQEKKGRGFELLTFGPSRICMVGLKPICEHMVEPQNISI